MEVTPVINSVFNSVTYVLSDPAKDELWLVDCGDIEKLDPSIPVAGVLLTHTHFDHVYGLSTLLKRCPEMKIFTNAYGKEALNNSRWNLSHFYPEIPDIVIDNPGNIVIIDERSELRLFGTAVTILPVPGHDESCMAYLIGRMLFTGDAFIPGKKVVTNLPRCNRELALKSQAYLQEISSQYELFPGHSE